MSEVRMKDQLLGEFAAAYERLIEAAAETERRGGARRGDEWGPREVVAHLAGWEIMANVRIPRIVAGDPPAEFADPRQVDLMNDAVNHAFVTLIGAQPLEALSGALRQAYQRSLAILRGLDERAFQPGEYVYERTLSAIEHCREHTDTHLS